MYNHNPANLPPSCFQYSHKFIFTNQTMKQITALLFLFSISLFSFSQPKNAKLTESRGRPADKFSNNKKQVLASVEKHQEELIQLSDQVWYLKGRFHPKQTWQFYFNRLTIF